MPDEKKGKPELWVSAGVVLLKNGKLAGAWHQVTDGKVDERQLLYEGQRYQRPAGAVHQVRVEREGTSATLYGGIGDFVRRWEGTAWIAEAEAASAAARVTARVRSDERKSKAVDAFDEQLAPLARAYRDADPVGRQVIIARAIRSITKGAWL